METQPLYMELYVSAASDKSGRKTNQDAYGFSDGSETVQSLGKDHTCHHQRFQQVNEFLAVTADGVSLADHTGKTKDDAAVLAVDTILNDLFNEFSLVSSMPLIADEINDTIIHASESAAQNLAAAVLAVGVYPDLISILSIGDCTLIRFRQGKAELITPLSSSDVLLRYAGNKYYAGRDLADIYQSKPEINDIYMLATDGLIKGFTDSCGNLRTEDMLKLFQEKEYSSEILIREAKKTSSDNLSVCVIVIENIYQ